MITPMKKVTILTLASHKEETLKALREMEIIHLTPLQNAAGASVNGAKGAVARVQKAMEVVPDKLRKGVTPAEKGASGVTLVEEIQTLITDKKNAEIQLEQAKEELEKLHAFGNLDPRTVKELAAKGGLQDRPSQKQAGQSVHPQQKSSCSIPLRSFDILRAT